MRSDEKRGEVTSLIARIEAGDDVAKERLVEVVYGELREWARVFMRRERRNHTLQTTALVHEAFLRLEQGKVLDHPRSRAYFFAAATKAMLQALKDHGRKHAAKKRGGEWRRVPLEGIVEELGSPMTPNALDRVILDEALEELQRLDGHLYQILILRTLGGFENQRIADHLRISLSTVEKKWRFSRAWLLDRLLPSSRDPASPGGRS